MLPSLRWGWSAMEIYLLSEYFSLTNNGWVSSVYAEKVDTTDVYHLQKSLREEISLEELASLHKGYHRFFVVESEEQGIFVGSEDELKVFLKQLEVNGTETCICA